METPLDVLSRAASMVETSEGRGDHLLYKGHSSVHDSQESPNKELPTKLQKQERLKERQGLPQTLNFDKEREAKFLSKSRCAGTQTQISSVENELPPLYINGSSRSDLTVDSYAAAHQAMLIQANQLMRERGSPPRYPSLDAHDTPLNLSLSNSTSQNSSYPSHVPRPSVITCAPNTERVQPKLSPSISPESLPSPSRREVRTELCDPAIEEHFRRSLGRDYTDYVSSKSSPKTPTVPSPTAPPPHFPISSAETKSQPQIATNVSITGSVDDHFAKSLGNSTWTALKAKKETVNELFTGSVDDHFAKALGGDTWLRIKAEKENGHCTSLSQQRHDSSLLSTQH